MVLTCDTQQAWGMCLQPLHACLMGPGSLPSVSAASFIMKTDRAVVVDYPGMGEGVIAIYAGHGG